MRTSLFVAMALALVSSGRVAHADQSTAPAPYRGMCMVYHYGTSGADFKLITQTKVELGDNQSQELIVDENLKFLVKSGTMKMPDGPIYRSVDLYEIAGHDFLATSSASYMKEAPYVELSDPAKLIALSCSPN